jgi:UDP-N-acetylmuramate dehydrogenase
MPAETLQIREHVPLAPLSTIGVGGAARWFARATTAADVAMAHRWGQERGIELFVLGGGSNIIVADEGLDRLVLQVAIRGLAFEHQDGQAVVTAGAGEVWDAVVAAAVDEGLLGIESLSGIPGLTGGTPIQNVGAYGQEVAHTIVSVAAFDRRAGQPVDLRATECGFSYRTSRFKGADAGRFIVTGVQFQLQRGRPRPTYPDVVAYLAEQRNATPGIGDVRRATLAVRRRKGMVLDDHDRDTRSVGSFFMNPIVTRDDCDRVASIAGTAPPSFTVDERRAKIPAAWLIERSGLHKGDVDGAVGLSSKHPLAIVNRGSATARDVLRLASRIKRQVADRFGVALRPEPIFVGLESDPDVTYLQGESA